MARKPKPVTDRSFCERLCRRIVFERAGNLCQRCMAAEATDWAHVIRRRFAAVRVVEDNTWALCALCHRTVDSWDTELVKLIERTIGIERYEELRGLAEAGPPMSYTLWWRAERERLTARCEELGISTKFRTSA